MEIQNELKTEIGNEEMITLKPTQVLVKDIEIKEVGIKHVKKVVFSCKHPDKEEVIHISAMKYEKKGKLATEGLWYNTDSEKLIKKDSTLAHFLNYFGFKTLEGVKEKQILTTTDDKGYLCFKGY